MVTHLIRKHPHEKITWLSSVEAQCIWCEYFWTYSTAYCTSNPIVILDFKQHIFIISMTWNAVHNVPYHWRTLCLVNCNECIVSNTANRSLSNTMLWAYFVSGLFNLVITWITNVSRSNKYLEDFIASKASVLCFNYSFCATLTLLKC